MEKTQIIKQVLNIGSKVRSLLETVFAITWLPILVILSIDSLEDVLNRLLFSPLWQTLNLSESLSLSITILALGAIEVYWGWRRYDNKYSTAHKRWYVFACLLYGYFYACDTWTYVKCFDLISCWLILIVAYPLGMLVHWLMVGLHFLFIKEKCDTTNDGVVPLFMVEDYPITEFNEDFLGYSGCAERIVKTITQSESLKSFSIGIEAPWGSGKTSMLNLIRKYINKDKSCIVVSFNPRQSASVDYIQEDFLSVVCNALKPFHLGASSAIHDYMRELKVLSKDTVWEKVIGLVHIKDTSKSREDVEQIIESVGKRLVVIIDDLDRLTGEEIMEVLKLIDKNASFKRTFFISAYDKRYVNHVLKHYLGDSIKTDFTDKYFTLEIPLPEKKSYRKVNFLWSQLCKAHEIGMIKVSKEEIKETINKIWSQIDSMLVTVRDIKRFLGSFFAVYAMVEDNVILRDYMLLQLLRVKTPNVYTNIKKGLYFKHEFFGGQYANNYTLKEEKDLQIDDEMIKHILHLLFPSGSSHSADDKDFGNRHLSWKRSFDYYFYGLESGHIDRRNLISLAKSEFSLKDFQQVTSQWRADNEKMEVADFVIERGELVQNDKDFEQYVRLIVMTRYYCPTHMIYWACVRLMAKANLGDYLKRYNVEEDVYIKTFQNLLEGREWVLSAVLLQDAIRLALTPGEEPDMIIDVKTLQSIADNQLDKVIKDYHGHKATSEDVYEMLKANICDVNPEETTISTEAIKKVLNSIISHPILYFSDMVGHKPKGKSGVEFVINEHLPFKELFKDEKGFHSVLNEIEGHNEHIKSTINRLSEVLGYVAENQYQPTYHATKGRNDNIKQGDYETYGLILEGER